MSTMNILRRLDKAPPTFGSYPFVRGYEATIRSLPTERPYVRWRWSYKLTPAAAGRPAYVFSSWSDQYTDDLEYYVDEAAPLDVAAIERLRFGRVELDEMLRDCFANDLDIYCLVRDGENRNDARFKDRGAIMRVVMLDTETNAFRLKRVGEFEIEEFELP